MGDLTENFSRSEFACPCCGKAEMKGELIQELQSLRYRYGKPIIITSGYRCDEYNRTVSTATLHPTGWAADLKTPRDGSDAMRLVELVFKIFSEYGIGIYDKHVHVDMRPNGAVKPWLWVGESR